MAFKSRVSDAVIRRLPMYYRYLKELEKAGVERISSRELGERMNLTASQIRQDINCFGGFGQQGYGYHVPQLRWHIGRILGLNESYDMILIGAGNVGRAVANYAGFKNEGFTLRAIFDVSPSLIGTEVNHVVVRPAEEIAPWLAANKADIAVIAVPSSKAQQMADIVTAAGVKAIWNFAPIDLQVPENVASNHVHLTDSLHILTYRMNEAALFEEIEKTKKG